MIRDEKIEIELIDDSINLNVDLECNTQDIEIEFSDYDDSEVKQQIAELQNNKVDKIEGKGLSTNDFTNEYKNNVQENTQKRHMHNNKSVLDTISNVDIENWNNKSDFSGDYQDLTNKPDLSGFITKDVDDLTYYYTKTEVDGKVSSVYRYRGTVSTYSDLPSTGLTIGDVYNVEEDGNNYAWTGTNWDKLGGEIDLSGYQTKIDSSHKLASDLVDDANQTNKFVTTQEKTTWSNKYDKPLTGIPKSDLSESVQGSLNTADDVKNSKFIVKEYPSYNDFPAIKIAYRYPTSFNYTWGPSEEYYTYENGKWVTDFPSIYLSITEPPYAYSYEDLQNVTCEITSQLPTGDYPDITKDSFSVVPSYVYTTPSYIEASYIPILTTSYGDSEHNPYTKGLDFTFDIIFPEKINPNISLNVLYKALDTGKLYIINPISLEWEEYTGSYLDGTPLMNVIDKTKQDKLNSGKNIKTINGASLLEGGDLSLATSYDLNSYLPKSYVKNARSTSTSGYTYNVRYINNMIKTSRTTANYNVYDCTYINNLIKTSKTTSSASNYTYSCGYIDSTFLTLETLPRWDGGNQ